MNVAPGQYQRAVDVLGLNEPYSDDDVNKAADVYEQTYGVPLVRPHEEDSFGVPTPKFATRLKTFAFKEPESGSVQGDPEVFRRELRKLMEIAKRKGFNRLSDREREAIQENRKALGMGPLDFAAEQRTAKEIAADAQKTYAHIQKNSATFNDRLAAVRGLSDIQTLELFAELDKSEQVRDAAQERIQAVKLAEVPEL